MNRERTLQEAARRYARLHANDCTQDERDATTEWLAECPERRHAYELADRVSADVSALAHDDRLGQKLRALADEAYAVRAVQPPRRWRVGAGLAASLFVAVLAWQGTSPTVTDSLQSVAYESTGAERRAVKLDDGSTVELDVDSRIAVRMSAERREIELMSGRAMFDVAHDPDRPFSVTAAGSRTTALGTKFQVWRDDVNVEVTLAEGSVAIDRSERSSSGDAWSERLSPGEQLSIDTSTQRRLRRVVDVNMSTSWMHGRHIFRGTPLHAAIDEVNRYATRKIRLGDASLANLSVAGNFIVGDSEVIVDAFAAVLPLRAVDGGDREIILIRSVRQ
ncbi:MAG TPA: FecR domain-containing protein [Steroidobacteraceae bacterium]|nr:FecR domain-containing protein [Steroidobacteraceae bacterium]